MQELVDLHKESIQNRAKRNDEKVKITTTYVDGNKIEVFTTFYEKDGQKSREFTYVNDKIEGLYQTWYSNGFKCEEKPFINNKREGLNQYWNWNGTLLVEYIYIDDKEQEGTYKEYWKGEFVPGIFCSRFRKY